MICYKVQIKNGAAVIVEDKEQELNPGLYSSIITKNSSGEFFEDSGSAVFSVFLPADIDNAAHGSGGKNNTENLYNFEPLNKQLQTLFKQTPQERFSLILHLNLNAQYMLNTEKLSNFNGMPLQAEDKRYCKKALGFITKLLDYLQVQYQNKLFALFIFLGTGCKTNTFLSFDNTNDTVFFSGEDKCSVSGLNAFSANEQSISQSGSGVFCNLPYQKEDIACRHDNSLKNNQMFSFFAKKLKAHSNGRYQVGAVYGALLDKNNKTFWRSCINLKQLLSNPDIDILLDFSCSLQNSEQNPFEFIPYASFRLHKKQICKPYISQNQLKQNIELSNNKKDGIISQSRSRSQINLRRIAELSTLQGCGCFWLNMCSGLDNYVESKAELKKAWQISERMWRKGFSSCAEVAVVADDESSFYLKQGVSLQHNLVFEQIQELKRMGMPYDTYFSSDLLHPEFRCEQYSFYVFLNLFAPEIKIVQAIENLRAKGMCMLFLYAPGYIYDNAFSIDNMNSLTGLKFKPAPIEKAQYIEASAINYGFCEAISPVFTECSGKVLGRYKGTDVPALTCMDRGKGFTAWSGAAPVPGRLLRWLAQRAGCFAYSRSSDEIFVNNRYLSVLSQRKGPRTLYFQKETVLIDQYTGEEYQTDNCRVTVPFKQNEMKLFECFFAKLPLVRRTEERNKSTINIDKMTTFDMLKAMNRENNSVPCAVESVLDKLVPIIDHIARQLPKGGRLIYVGAGTSGRLAVSDAAECPPTFGVPHGQIIALMAGGLKAIECAAEQMEDNEAEGKEQLRLLKLTPLDTVVGISAAGAACYVIGALKQARENGCATACICCNQPNLIERYADWSVFADTGPEAVTGSTRLKAGTAQKLILNLISTAIMIKTGKVYENLMVNIKPGNQKLLQRAVGIISALTGVDEAQAQTALESNESSILKAVKAIKEEA